MLNINIRFTLALLLLPLQALADTQSDAADNPNHFTHSQFTLQEAFALAFQHNLDLQLEQQRNDIRRDNESAAFRRLLPSVSLNSSASDTVDHSNPSNEQTCCDLVLPRLCTVQPPIR